MRAVPISEIESRLRARARIAKVEIDSVLLLQLTRYLATLWRWNRHINLTALGDPDKAIDRLVIEPLVAAEAVPSHASSLLDVGSGGGSPAIPLKLKLPHLALVMVESRARKAAFLREVGRELELAHLDIRRRQFEDLIDESGLAHSMEVLSVRAVRVGPRQLKALRAFLAPGGVLLWFRGPRDVEAPALQGLEVVGDRPLVAALGSRLLILRASG